MNIAPAKKPTAAGIHFNPGYIDSDISMAGFKRDQKLAATITPPVKPNMGSKMALLIDLKKNTREAPSAVTSQVKVVANKAAHMGPILEKKCCNCSMALV
jgi:hypothetical protein